LLEFLKEQGVSTVDEVLLSHADEDHIGGLLGLLASNEFHVNRVRLNSDSLKGSKIWDDLLFELDRLARSGGLDFSPVLTVAESGAFDHNDVQLEVLGPSRYLAGRGPGSKDRAGRKITTHSISGVVAVRARGVRLALFTGDVDQVGIDDMLATAGDLTCPILVFPHHGGGGSLAFADRLLRAVRPACVVFSIGRGKHKTPAPEAVASVLRAVPSAHIACTQLSEHCAPTVPKAVAPHLAPVFARGREGRSCCAGTVLVELDGGHQEAPSAGAHGAFIATHAPTALCRRSLPR
jgi:competence protein ComEC